MTLLKFDPNKKENIIKDRIRSMIDKVKRTGTSQDREEWVTYSNESVYRGFACMVARFPIKGFGYRYKGMAKEITGSVTPEGKVSVITFETPYAKTVQDAGKLLYKYIDAVRGVVKQEDKS